MDKRNVKDIYKLSPTQYGLLFNTLYASEAGVFVEQSVKTVQDLDVSNYIRAWQKMIERHPVLRTAFFWEDLDEPLQVVMRQVELPVEQLDWRALDRDEQQKRLEHFLGANRRRGFDFSKAPLMRLTLIRLDEATHVVVNNYHHILFDGWSSVLISKEVAAWFEALQQGRTVDLPQPRPFRDYISWLQGQDWEVEKAFWRKKLADFTVATPLSVDRAPGSLLDPKTTFDRQRIRLSAETTDAVQAFTRQHHITANTLIQAAWALLLHRYSGERDVLFGMTVHGRPTKLGGFESMVGLFINAIPVRVQIPCAGSVLEWLRALQVEFTELLRYGYSPLVEIQTWNDIPRNKAMFDYVLVDQSDPSGAAGDQDADHFDLFEITGYPLTLYLYLHDRVILQITYDRQRFDDDAVARLLSHLRVLLGEMVTGPEQQLSQVAMLTDVEQGQLLGEWSGLGAGDAGGRCVHELFEAQAEQSPDATAIVFQDQHLTYQELDRRANQLAHYLQTQGVGPEVCVGILLERSLEMMVSVLAIAKAGGAYVPLDIAHPAERLSFILQDTRVGVLVTHSQLLAGLPEYELRKICLDVEGAAIAQACKESPASLVTAENLVYMVYTSGSMGKPKGVAVTHGNLASIYRAWEVAYELNFCDCHLQMANFSFDVFSGDWVRALCSGAKLVLCPRELLLAPEELYDLLNRERVDCGEFVPVVARSLIEYLQETRQALDFMRLLIVGSDSWYVQEYRQLRQLCSAGTRLVNSYGLSETTIDSTCFEDAGLDLDAETMVPVGRSFANTEFYVLDAYLRLAPVGVPGELYVGGQGVARGYVNRLDLTAERFVPHPFPSSKGNGGGRRLYRTGDLTRYLPDGNLELLGRVDQQVKIRGFRVELGEIEAVLGGHPAVRETVVAVSEDGPGHTRLVAYVVSGREQTPAFSELRSFLKQRLPDYMIPAAFVSLDALPQTPSGKVDRRALPAPGRTRPELEKTLVAPRTATEEILAELWAEALDVDQVGVYDNFFELGGHSMLAPRIMAQIRETFQVELSLVTMFRQPTVAELAVTIEEILLQEIADLSEDEALLLVEQAL